MNRLLQLGVQPGLNSEFQASQGYIETLSQKLKQDSQEKLNLLGMVASDLVTIRRSLCSPFRSAITR